VLGRYTEIRPLDADEIARRQAHAEQKRRLEGQ
jgi:hypothetical protein